MSINSKSIVDRASGVIKGTKNATDRLKKLRDDILPKIEPIPDGTSDEERAKIMQEELEGIGTTVRNYVPPAVAVFLTVNSPNPSMPPRVNSAIVQEHGKKSKD